MKILCFSPNDAIWIWALPQALALEALQQDGHEIVYISCEREFSGYCMAMAASGVRIADGPAAKRRICDKCVRQTRMIRREFGFRGYELGTQVAAEARREAEDIAAGRPLDELADYRLLDIPVGRLALYETIIQNKLADSSLSGPIEAFYRVIFRNTCIAVRGIDAILRQETPDVCVTYHTAYAYNRAFQLLGEQRGCPVYFVNAGFNVAKNFRHLVVAKSDPEDLFRRLIGSWSRFADLPCAPERLASVTDHLIGLMRGGGFAYSVALDARRQDPLQRLGVPAGRKLLLATMSSYDELLAAEKAGFGWTTRNDVFASQIEWVKWLFEFMQRNPELHLIVRVHPREFQVQGKGVRSQHSYQLEAAFRDPPPNVSINWPSDQIPVYELMLHADVLLNAWSSAGMEAGLLGIPVVTYCGEVLLFPRQLTYDVTERSAYEEGIGQALKDGWSIERARVYYRWAALMLEGIAVDMDDALPEPAGAKRSTWQRVRGRLDRTLRPGLEELRQIRGRPSRLRHGARITALVERGLAAFYELGDPEAAVPTLDVETRALREEMRRLSDYLRSAMPAESSRLAQYFS